MSRGEMERGDKNEKGTLSIVAGHRTKTAGTDFLNFLAAHVKLSCLDRNRSFDAKT